jgi:hypothetical protein
MLRLIWVVGLILNGSDFIKRKGYFCSNLDHSTKIQRSGWLLLHSVGETEEATGRRHGQRQESSGSHYGALNFDLILPTRSRRHKEPILHTCGGENGSQRVGGIGAVQAVYNGGEVFFLRCSDFKDVCRSFLVLLASCPANSSKWRWKTWIWWPPRVRRFLTCGQKSKLWTMLYIVVFR